MFVVKRDGHKEPVMFDKITARIRKLCYGLNSLVDPVRVSMRVIEGLYDGVTTSELDNLAAEVAATMTTSHPDYTNLASRISVSNLHKNTKKSFSETMADLYNYVNPRTGKKAPLLSDEVYKVIKKNSKNYSDIKLIFNIKEVLISSLNSKIKSQIARTREESSSPKNTRLYFEILKKTETIITHYVQLLELYSDKYVEKVSPTQIDEQD